MRTCALTAFALLAACSSEDAGDPELDKQPPSDKVAIDPPESTERREPATEERKDPVDRQSRQSAREILKRYFALIQAGRHEDAAELWGDSGRAAASAAELGRFGDFRPSIAAPGRVEGAAGSIYLEISLQLLRDSPSKIEVLSDGTAVLRRANGIPGSSAEELAWRLDRLALRPPPVPLAH